MRTALTGEGEPGCAQRGAALTEFVIVMPLFVAIIYGSMHLTELGMLKLEAQEIARYTAWGMASRPMSDFDERQHRATTTRAKNDVRLEVAEVYADLDGARQGTPGRRGMMVSGVFAPSPFDIRTRPVALLPGVFSAEWAAPLSSTGFVLSALGIGTGVQDLFSGPFNRLGFNASGEVHGRARVYPMKPVNPADAERARLLAATGAPMGADLSRWSPTGYRPIRTQGPEGRGVDISTVLIADSWRLPDGASAHPRRAGPYSKTVQRVSDKAIEALPGGSLINMILSLVGFAGNLPGGLGAIFGVPPQDPMAHTFSRPYVSARPGPPSYSGPERAGAGTVNIFEYTRAGSRAEPGQVQVFDTMPMRVDHGGGGGYVDALNARGANFMGCPQGQRRRCR